MSQSESPRDFYHRLESGLSPLIRLMLAEHLPKIGGRKWWEACVLSSLTPIQLEYVREPENLEQFDFPALVNIVHHNWRTLRPSLGIGNEFTNYLFSLKTLRNEVEHRPDLVLDDERRRHLEQSARLAMRLLNKDETTGPNLCTPLVARSMRAGILASAIAVVYTFILSVLIYREVKWRDLPQLILESVVTTSIVLLLIGFSVGMSWAMTNADIPYMISDALMGVSENPVVILLLINIVLLIVGIFMDMTPAVLIFTPIFLPIAEDLGMNPVHFGIMMVANLCIGLLTPPVGSALFVGCSISGVKIQQLIKPLLPFYAALLIALMMIVYIPPISLFIPQLLGLM